MARLARASAGLVLAMGLGLAAAAGPAQAGDRAFADFIGFSLDGRYFAFEEYGIQDGSGFAYSSIYVVDLAEDKWVPGSPFRYRTDDESVSLGRARNEVAAMAAGMIAKLEITEPAQILALNGEGEFTDGRTLEFAPPGFGPGETLDPLTLELEVYDAKTPDDCAVFTGEPGKGYALTLTDIDGARELHRDAGTLPKSRGCITDYRIYAVLTPLYTLPTKSGVAIISTYPVGFEGPDRRFLAVPTNY